MEEWPCRLEAQEEDANPVVAPTIVVRNAENNPLGTISKNDSNEVVVTYNPKITADPTQMVATFAHELSHYLTGTAPEPPPGGWGNWEFATDIGATFMGFGLFMANAAFSFRQYTDGNIQGWQTSGGGYLSLEEYSYSLAIFLKLKDMPYESAAPYCRPNIKGLLKRAFKEIEKTSIIKELKEVG